MSSRNNGGVGVQSIPAGSRKMVQSLKEIVNCPEPEIYAMLKECNMDPNEAVNRLLTQDTFHEVKSKREKRKESKDTTESRPRGAISNSGRGSRGGAERYVGRGGSAESTKPIPGYRKENGSNTSSLTSTLGVSGSNISRRATTISDIAANESKKLAPAAVDVSSVSQRETSSGYQPTWGGVPGQVSMADIVKMGRPQSKVPSAPNVSHHNVNANQNHIQGLPSGASHQNTQWSDDHTTKVSEVHREPQHLSTDEEWPLIEPPSVASQTSISEPPADSELHPDPANLSYDRINHQNEIDEVQGTDNCTIENLGSPPSRRLQEDNAGGASIYENDLYGYQNQNHTFDHQQVEDVNDSVSSVAANLQQLNVQDDGGVPPEGDGPSVVIPDHLQVQTADCSHLSFGSFGSGIGGSFSGPLASAPVTSTLEDAPKEVDGSSVGHSGSRASEYYGDESLRHASESNLYHRTNASSVNYDSPSASQPEPLTSETNEQGNQYSYPSSAAGYTYESAQQLTAAFSQPQTSSQMQNLTPFSNVMAFTNSLPSTLSAANVHAGRETDLSYLPFSATQTMAMKYGSSVSSIGGSTISMPESLKSAGFPSAQSTQQTLSGTSVTTGPTVPQHLAVHPYNQPTLPLGPFGNMISYPFMPQSYTYMPSAFQQPFAGNSNYHQSLAAVLPQYKNSVSVSSLPQPASVASAYGGFGNTASIPGNFPMNPPAAPSGTNLSYDDMLSSQYKDTNHLMSLQQSENSAMWLHGPGSRTMSAVPANTYYGFQGQNQQSSGFRQAQQPLQNHGSLGYPNFYHSQAGISLEHQQQNPRDGSLGGGSQGQPKPSQQLWQSGGY
ncbi:uncharacterized protein LOC125836143 isoform X1 [Solanum verrucosum]|uniref:uncharacterized protein LOC125836143 isoform X1 n=1 Tax=Solanum verrucosum TaxID=315347 RepID=UPI0020D1973A|nr:uncharacterized protein LOC125836143 isoform X1 [Solanum verrucosum]